MNLGAHFDLPPAQWPLLYQRLDDLLAGQSTLMDYPEEVENRIVAQLISQAETSLDADDKPSTSDWHSVNVDSLQLVRPRTVGVEHVEWSRWGCRRYWRSSRSRRRTAGSLGDLLDVDFEN